MRQKAWCGMKYVIEERSNGSVEINEENGKPVAVMAYYPDGKHLETAKKIVELLNMEKE
uniref:Uncharacterized protein n=1 Tax=viral metagenome TaxID=1070528 RepID=A0A6M3J1H8_9ZZZZ